MPKSKKRKGRGKRVAKRASRRRAERRGKFPAELDAILGRVALTSDKGLVARQAFVESLDTFDRSFTKLGEQERRLRLVRRGNLSLDRWQREFVDAVKGFFHAMYEALGAFALFLNHAKRELFADAKRAWAEVTPFLDLLLRHGFGAEPELKQLLEANVFRAFIAHPQQHRAHDWLTCAWPGASGQEATVVWFTRTGDFVYAIFEVDPYSPTYIPSIDHDSFKVPPRPRQVYRALYRAAIKVTSATLLGEDASLPAEDFPAVAHDAETRSTHYAMIGVFLGKEALNAPEPEKTKLYEKAIEKFELAMSVWPLNHAALNNWGWMIYEEAQRVDHPQEKLNHFAAAFEKIQASVAMKGDYLYGLTNLGELLLETAAHALESEPPSGSSRSSSASRRRMFSRPLGAYGVVASQRNATPA